MARKISNKPAFDAFNHERALVPNIEKFTADYIASNSTISAPDSQYRNLDGLYVHWKLADFASAVRKRIPSAKFGVNRHCGATHLHSGLRAPEELWLYVPGQEYAIMRLGYSIYQNANNDRLYGVYSRLIQNRKYSDSADQYNMALTEDAERAVHNACKYLRKYSTTEVMNVSASEYLGEVSSERSELGSNMYVERKRIREMADLVPELVHLYKSGYEFQSQMLKQQIAAFIAAEQANNAIVSRAAHAWFVRTHMDLSEDVQKFTVIELFDTDKASNYRSMRVGENVTYIEDDLPEEFVGKLSVLSMMEIGRRVPEVGMRTSETTYFLDRT